MSRSRLRTLVGVISTLALAPAGALELVDTGGAPVVGARVEVWVQPATDNLLSWVRSTLQKARSDAAGQVEVEWPVGQAHLVLIDHPGFAPWWGQPATSQSRLALAPGSRLQGRVVGLGEGAVGEACARWRVPLEGWRRARTYRRCAPLAADGSFQISGLGDHSVDLTVVAPGRLPAERTVTPGRELPPIQLLSGFPVTGRVVDPLRRPVAGARLRWRGVEIATTGAEGEFRAAVAGFPITLDLRAPGLRRTELELAQAPSARPLEVRMAWGQQLRGTLLSSGEAVGPEGLRLHAERHQRDGRDALRPFPVVPEEDGSFEVELPREGVFDLRLTVPGQRDLDLGTVHVVPGAVVDLGNILLDGGSGVRGRVVDERGAPLAGVLFELVALDGLAIELARRGKALQDVSNPDGTFEVRGALPGDYELRSRSGGRPLRSLEVTIEHDRVIDLEDWQLDRGCRLRGQILSRAGSTSGPGLKIVLLAPGGSRLEPLAETRADESGRFDLGLVTPEAYFVEARSGARRVLSERIEPVPTEGGDCPVEVTTGEVAVSGLVTRRGVPVSGGVLELVRADDPGLEGGKHVVSGGGDLAGQKLLAGGAESLSTTLVSPAGTFEVAMAPGDVRVTYTDREGRRVERREVIPDADAARLRIDIGGQTLQGVVVDRDSRQGQAASLRLFTPDGGLVASSTSGPDGHFELAGLAAESGRLVVSAPGHEVVAREFDALPAEPVTVELPARGGQGRLLVRLLDGGGVPAVGVRCTLLDEVGGLVRFATTQWAGEAELEGIPAGRYSLVWSSPAGVGARTGVEVQADGLARVEARVGGLPLALSCDPERCGQRLLQGLQLVARTSPSTSLDLAPYLPRYVIPQRFSPTGLLWLGNVAPGDYHLRLVLEGQVIEKPVHLPGTVELF